MVVIAFVLVSGQGYAQTPDRALENPLFLAEVGDTRLVYASYATGAEQLLVSYVEYDEFASGYGAFTFLTSGKEEEGGTVSFVAVKEYDNTNFGIGIYRGNGVTSLDAGLSYGFSKVDVRVGVHDVPLNRWQENKDQINVSLGASVDITDCVRVGVDARPGDAWEFDFHSQIEVTPNLATRVSVGFEQTKWQDAGLEVWLSRNQVLIHIGYTLNQDLTSDFRLGLGFRF